MSGGFDELNLSVFFGVKPIQISHRISVECVHIRLITLRPTERIWVALQFTKGP